MTLQDKLVAAKERQEHPSVPEIKSAPMFKRATRRQAKLRLAINGPGGSGKTFTALRVGSALGGKIAVIDTERGSASKYAHGRPFEFDHHELETFEPRTYVQAIKVAGQEGYDVLIIDSLSHAWSGKGGALEQVDMRAGSRGSTFTAWREVTPMHNELVDAILTSPCHVIATMRTKTEYAVENDDRGKIKVRKLGMAPIQRDGIEYEFDVVGDMDQKHVMTITKTRCAGLDDEVIEKPGEVLAKTLRDWLSDGDPPLGDESRQLIGDLLRFAKDGDTPRFEAAGAWRKSRGYPAWSDFFSKGTEPEGLDLLTVLGTPVLAPEAPVIKEGEEKAGEPS